LTIDDTGKRPPDASPVDPAAALKNVLRGVIATIEAPDAVLAVRT